MKFGGFHMKSGGFHMNDVKSCEIRRISRNQPDFERPTIARSGEPYVLFLPPPPRTMIPQCKI